MSNKDNHYDLYLFAADDKEHLIKLSHLTQNEAVIYADYWTKLNNNHSYMRVLEGSTPWCEPMPEIKNKTSEWLIAKYNIFLKETN